LIITLQHFLVLSVTLFSLGVIGMAARRGFVVSIMCLQLMLIGSCLALAAFSRWNLLVYGKAACLVIMGLSICAIAVSLAVYHVMYRKTGSANSDSMCSMRG
jgi:NADH-quinone oxidoreductase subunit K